MDPTGTDVTIRCSRLKALILLFVGVPLFAFINLLFLFIIATTPLIAKGTRPQDLATIYLLFPPLIVLFSWVVWSVIVNRETLFTTIRVSSAGVTIENSRYGVLPLSWSDLTRATYSKLGKAIKLESPRLSKPFAIMNLGRGGLAPEFLAARTMIRSAVRDRWSERWL